MHPSTTASSGSGIPRPLRFAMWALAIALAAFQTFAYRHLMNPDGLSYLDSARAFANGDFMTGLNPHWGPLYPAALAVALRLVRPGPAMVVPLAHAVNFLFFIVALAAFDFFLRELLRDRDRDRPVAASAFFGYAMFVYAAAELTGLRFVTPDLGVMASVFCAAGLIVRMQRRGVTLGTAALLGLVLALGYFSKSVMFVLGAALIGGLVFLPNAGPKRWQAIATAALVFLGVASMLIVPFSRRVGTPTFGTAGKLAYNWEVNHVPYTNWQGDGHSHLEHPPRQVRSNPDLFEYTHHLQGTYPPWSDPAYWNAGTVAPFRPKNQAVQLLRSGDFYVRMFLGSTAAVATLLVLLTWGGHLRRQLSLLLPAFAALVVYAPIHLEPRYVAPFAALLWLVPILTAAAPLTADRDRLLARATILAALLLAAFPTLQTLSHLSAALDDRDPHPIVAAELHRLGLAPGDRVANVGGIEGESYGSSFEGYWAYLAGLQIVAEIPEQKDFICRDSTVTDRVFKEFAAVGARAVITRAIPVSACTAGWREIDGTDFYVRLLRGEPRLDESRSASSPGSPDAK